MHQTLKSKHITKNIQQNWPVGDKIVEKKKRQSGLLTCLVKYFAKIWLEIRLN